MHPIFASASNIKAIEQDGPDYILTLDNGRTVRATPEVMGERVPALDDFWLHMLDGTVVYETSQEHMKRFVRPQRPPRRGIPKTRPV